MVAGGAGRRSASGAPLSRSNGGFASTSRPRSESTMPLTLTPTAFGPFARRSFRPTVAIWPTSASREAASVGTDVSEEIPPWVARPALRRVPPTSKTSTLIVGREFSPGLDRLASVLAYYSTHHDDLSK